MEGEAGEPYIPTVYKNGEPCEERNLLTSRFCEKFELTRPSDYALGTESLKYRIIDERGLLASVSGICDDAAEVYIPSKVRLLGKTYTVTEIDSSAFAGNKSITKVVLSDTVEKICSGAFSECHNLTALIGGDGLAEIGDAAFFNAEISELYIPAGFKRFGTDSFTSDGFDIKYELYSDDFLKIENPPDALLFCGEKNRKISLEFRLQSPTRELLSVKLDGEEAI